MANKNFWRGIFCCCKTVEENLRQEAGASNFALKARIFELEKQVAALAGGLYRIERYSIGPNQPDTGTFEKEVILSDVPVSLREELFSRKMVDSASGSSPVSWSGTRWILIKK